VLTRNRIGLIALVSLALVVILVPGLRTDFLDVATGILFPGKSDSQIQGLGGRLSMWEGAIAVASTRPLVGHGFAVQARLEGLITAHNVFVQVFLDTGIVGVVLFSVSLLMFVKEVVQRWNTVPLGLTGCLAAFISVLVHSMGLPIVGAQWLAPSFAFAAFAGLYMNHVYCATNHRLLHPEFEYARRLGY